MLTGGRLVHNVPYIHTGMPKVYILGMMMEERIN